MSLEQGRKNYLTQSDKEWLIQFLKPDSFNKSDQEFKDEVQALVDMNMDESGKPRVTISDRFLRDLENELVIKTGGAEETTDARAAAVADKLNSYTFAALSTLIVKIVHRGLICNADATQYTVGYDSKRKITGKYIEKINGAPLKILPVKDNTGGVLFTIKYYVLIGAGGDQAEPVYIIANDSMGPDEIDVHKVSNLALRPDGLCGIL